MRFLIMKSLFGTSFTVALLSAVAVVGITLFGSEVLGAWKAGNAEEALLSSGALNFNAPAETVEQMKTDKSKNALLTKNWKFTQNSLADTIQNIYIQALQLEFITIVLERFLPQSPLTAFALALTQSYVTRANAFLVNVLHLPPIPVASPSS